MRLSSTRNESPSESSGTDASGAARALAGIVPAPIAASRSRTVLRYCSGRELGERRRTRDGVVFALDVHAARIGAGRNLPRTIRHCSGAGPSAAAARAGARPGPRSLRFIAIAARRIDVAGARAERAEQGGRQRCRQDRHRAAAKRRRDATNGSPECPHNAPVFTVGTANGAGRFTSSAGATGGRPDGAISCQAAEHQQVAEQRATHADRNDPTIRSVEREQHRRVVQVHPQR